MAVAVTAASFGGIAAFTSEPAQAAPTLPEFASPGQMDVLNRTGRVWDPSTHRTNLFANHSQVAESINGLLNHAFSAFPGCPL